jgi:hypothetical protein
MRLSWDIKQSLWIGMESHQSLLVDHLSSIELIWSSIYQTVASNAIDQREGSYYDLHHVLFFLFTIYSVKTPGGNLVFQYRSKIAKGRKCGDCGSQIQGVSNTFTNPPHPQTTIVLSSAEERPPIFSHIFFDCKARSSSSSAVVISAEIITVHLREAWLRVHSQRRQYSNADWSDCVLNRLLTCVPRSCKAFLSAKRPSLVLMVATAAASVSVTGKFFKDEIVVVLMCLVWRVKEIGRRKESCI